ncbi:protein C [Uncultured phage WW-nAnB strain 3]|uniref:protein C n=1 Tax=Uncultured phage WW-nAnB strain 3 TaxID=1449897 RepID=UPI0003E3CA38|nr:protein C [Uncultured phage WW-nAnB strain 3]AHH02854.1 protein C [Uncultured phage WW-nAnB strain 3]
MYGESGTLTPYLHLSPYVNGEVYAATFETLFSSYLNTFYDGSRDSPYHDFVQVWACPVNYPDWWRADLPLGRTSYVELDSPEIIPSGTSSLFNSISSFHLVPQNKTYSFDISTSEVIRRRSGSSSADTFLSSASPFYVVRSFSPFSLDDLNNNSGSGGDYLTISGPSISLPSSSPSVSLLWNSQYVLHLNQNQQHYSWAHLDTVPNASLSSLQWLILPDMEDWSDAQYLSLDGKTLKFSVRLSFWIDANKLPAGLNVGDSFPASDEFDSLRDSLLDKYDVEKQIGDTEAYLDEAINGFHSVDSDVASSASGLLGGLFQNLRTFLFSVSLLCLGAVILRIVLRKAVD